MLLASSRSFTIDTEGPSEAVAQIVYQPLSPGGLRQGPLRAVTSFRLPQPKADSTESFGHDSFASARFVVFLMALLGKHYKETVSWLRSLFTLLLPADMPLKLRVNHRRQKLDLQDGRVDLSQISSRSIFKERMPGKGKVPRQLKKRMRLEVLLQKMMPLQALRWLLYDIVDAVGCILDVGVACKSFPTGPSEKDTFSTQSSVDLRDLKMRDMRMRASLSKAWNADRKKTADNKAPQTAADKALLRMQAEASRDFVWHSKRRRRGGATWRVPEGPSLPAGSSMWPWTQKMAVIYCLKDGGGVGRVGQIHSRRPRPDAAQDGGLRAIGIGEKARGNVDIIDLDFCGLRKFLGCLGLPEPGLCLSICRTDLWH